MPKLKGRELDEEIVKYFGGDIEEVRRQSEIRAASFSRRAGSVPQNQ